MKKKILNSFYAFEEANNPGYPKISVPMMIINNMMHVRGKHIYEEFGLTQAEIDMIIVLHIYNDGLTAAEVSERLVFSSGGISKVVKKLELKELIYKKDSLEDKRSSLIYLEEKAKAIIDACMPQFGENDKYFLDILNETEREILEKAFKKILYSLSED